MASSIASQTSGIMSAPLEPAIRSSALLTSAAAVQPLPPDRGTAIIQPIDTISSDRSAAKRKQEAEAERLLLAAKREIQSSAQTALTVTDEHSRHSGVQVFQDPEPYYSSPNVFAPNTPVNNPFPLPPQVLVMPGLDTAFPPSTLINMMGGIFLGVVPVVPELIPSRINLIDFYSYSPIND